MLLLLEEDLGDDWFWVFFMKVLRRARKKMKKG